MTFTHAPFVPFARPDIDAEEIEAVTACLQSGWLTTGPRVRQFEEAFAAYLGARHAVAVNSCTAAMHLALEAVGLRPGDLVITTPYTFAATAEVIRYFDAIPIFVDIEADTLNMDPRQAAEAVKAFLDDPRSQARDHWLPPALRHPSSVVRPSAPAVGRPKALLPVHIGGHPCDMRALEQVATRHHLALIEDAAHALPARHQGRLIGQAQSSVAGPSSLVCFSFYATKTLTTGEGGMIVTEDADLAERCRIMSLHGISKDAWKRYTAEGNWYYEIIAPGYKYNMTDVAAALGLVQLGKLEKMWRRRRDIAQYYTQLFSSLPELETPTEREDVQHAWHLYILRLHLDRLCIDRARFIHELRERGVGASVHFIPLHLHPYYRETYGFQPHAYPVAYREYQRVISLPIYSAMSDADVQRVGEAVCDIVRTYRR
ncbi:MAG: DegT/DnrJ/EryC1/StrS aminotransferase family protein [Caldilineae bacterium]|nr:MAG: DegT/DnrJ/EryC1/StrS aminotransferase family protein [Caldilineae bacterium]